MMSFPAEVSIARIPRRELIFLIGQIAFVFGLVYPESLRQVRKQGYLRQLLGFRSDNPDTRRKMKLIAETVDRYIDQKTQA